MIPTLSGLLDDNLTRIATLEDNPICLKARAMGLYSERDFGAITPQSWAKYLCRYGSMIQMPDVPDHVWRSHGEVRAWIYQSQWLVECEQCKVTVPASKTVPLFYCPRCRMGWNAGLAQRVQFPQRIAELETLLLMRPRAVNRNWKYPETVGDIARENQAHKSELIINDSIIWAIRRIG